jgi:hypothetical protein
MTIPNTRTRPGTNSVVAVPGAGGGLAIVGQSLWPRSALGDKLEHYSDPAAVSGWIDRIARDD